MFEVSITTLVKNMEKFIKRAITMTWTIIFFTSCPPIPNITFIAIYRRINIKKILDRSRTTTQPEEIKGAVYITLERAMAITALKNIPDRPSREDGIV